MWGMRVRAVVDRNPVAVAVVLAGLALLGGWLAYGAYVAPGATTTQVVTAEATVEGGFDHRATVTDGTAAFERETVLRNRSVYYYRVSPRLTGEYTVRLTEGSDASLETTVVRTATVEAVEGLGAEAATLWEVAAGTASRGGALTGEGVTVSFERNVSEVAERARNISERLGGPRGRLRFTVAVEVLVTGMVGDRTVNRTVEDRLVVALEEGVYRVRGGTTAEGETAAPPSVSVTDTTRVTTERTPGPLRALGGPVLAGGGLLGLVAVLGAWGTGRLALTDPERAWLAYVDDRADYDEWISAVRLPPEARELPVAEADSLAALVDVAIDTGEPVLADATLGAYVVVHDGYRYVFEPPTPPAGATPPDAVARAGGTADPLGEAGAAAGGTGRTGPQDGTGADTGSTRAGGDGDPDLRARLLARSYQRLRGLAAEADVDAGPNPSKEELVAALVAAGVDPDAEDGNREPG